MNLQRLSEPSTYAGLTGLIGMVGVSLPEGIGQYISYALAGIAGIVSILLKEKGAAK